MRVLRFWLASLLIGFSACSVPAAEERPAAGKNIVTVIGAIHGQHRRSQDYSLDVLQAAIIKFDPDIIMVELPPERYAIASENYDRFGEVRESRTDDFPELIDVVFPLRAGLGFEMIPVAAWTQEIADDRRTALAQLEGDPARVRDWAEHESAMQAYSSTVRGKSDDPAFIHSAAYDGAVKTRQETFERLFGQDLGAGGWQNINLAHYRLIDNALDQLKGQEKRILILYGAWHKYWFLEALEARGDIQLRDAAELFDN